VPHFQFAIVVLLVLVTLRSAAVPAFQADRLVGRRHHLAWGIGSPLRSHRMKTSIRSSKIGAFVTGPMRSWSGCSRPTQLPAPPTQEALRRNEVMRCLRHRCTILSHQPCGVDLELTVNLTSSCARSAVRWARSFFQVLSKGSRTRSPRMNDTGSALRGCKAGPYAVVVQRRKSINRFTCCSTM
jgi:hypothetical protein